MHGFTPAMDAEITAAYRDYTRSGGRFAITACVKKLNIEGWKVHQRAQYLGLARAKELPWSQEELTILRENRHYSVGEIRRRLRVAGFVRSNLGVTHKRQRLQLTTRHCGEGYTGNVLSGLFGIDRHAIGAWIDKGLLRADLCLTARRVQQHGDRYWIKREDVRAFVFAFPEQIDFRKVDGVWLIELLRERGPELPDEELTTP